MKPKQNDGHWCSILCDCGHQCGQYLQHYGLVKCSCDRVFWALRPKRNGPLILYPWPGHNLSRNDMAA